MAKNPVNVKVKCRGQIPWSASSMQVLVVSVSGYESLNGDAVSAVARRLANVVREENKRTRPGQIELLCAEEGLPEELLAAVQAKLLKVRRGKSTVESFGVRRGDKLVVRASRPGAQRPFKANQEVSPPRR